MAPGRRADVARGRELVAALAERQALVHRDVAHAERARLVDERLAVALVVEEEAGRAAGRAELGVGLEGGRLEARRLRVHAFELAGQGRHAAAVQQQPLAAVERVGAVAGGAGGLEVERVGVEAARHVREHAHGGVAVEEHVLQQGAAGQALDVVGQPAAALGHVAEGVGAGLLAPGALRIHVMQLDVEDELVAGERLARRRELEPGLVRQRVASALPAGGGEGAVEGAEARRRAEQGDHVAPARLAETPRAFVERLLRQRAGMARRGVERHRRELAVGGGIELDRQPQAGVAGCRHDSAPGTGSHDGSANDGRLKDKSTPSSLPARKAGRRRCGAASPPAGGGRRAHRAAR